MENVVHAETDVAYLPTPNRVEVVLSGNEAPDVLTSTAFVLPVDADGAVLLADNRRRGIEVAGGHREDGETMAEAARREGREELGCEVGDLIPIGFLRMTSEGQAPEGWRYPHPVSYQQFYAARLVKRHAYEPNDECHAPVRMWSFGHLARRSIGIMALAAISAIRDVGQASRI